MSYGRSKEVRDKMYESGFTTVESALGFVKVRNDIAEDYFREDEIQKIARNMFLVSRILA